MAIVDKQSPLGSMTGKIGDLVLSKWKKLQVSKQAPVKKRKKKKKKGEPQSDQAERLGMVTHFLSPFKEYIALGFKNKNSKNPAFQTAVEYNLAHAVTGAYPEYKIDVKKVAFSKGSLDMAWGAKFGLIDSCHLYVSWEVPETSNLRTASQEIAVLIVYSEEKERVLNIGHELHTRADLEINEEFADIYHGHTLQAWIFFCSADGKASSRTRYIGSVRVPEKPAAVTPSTA